MYTGLVEQLRFENAAQVIKEAEGANKPMALDCWSDKGCRALAKKAASSFQERPCSICRRLRACLCEHNWLSSTSPHLASRHGTATVYITLTHSKALLMSESRQQPGRHLSVCACLTRVSVVCQLCIDKATIAQYVTHISRIHSNRSVTMHCCCACLLTSSPADLSLSWQCCVLQEVE